MSAMVCASILYTVARCSRSEPGYSKLANILFAKQLQKKMDADGINGVSIVLHPGGVKTSEYSNELYATVLTS